MGGRGRTWLQTAQAPRWALEAELSALEARLGWAAGLAGGGRRQDGQTSERSRGQWPLCVFPGQGSQAQGKRQCVGCGALDFGKPDVGRWTLRSGVEVRR